MTQSAPQTGISLKVTKTINAPRERVFAPWTNPNCSTNGEALTRASINSLIQS
ncbi:MAG: hypothetical protein MK109_08925 [Dehalococcoidia bacterium]|nr:hypothetical protein [Dehalococcoidia bacterium]